MKKKEIGIRKHYRAKVSGILSTVRIAGESVHGGWDAVNVSTGRHVRIRTAGRLRFEVPGPRERWGPEAYAQKAKVASDAGDFRLAAELYREAAGASIGHNRRGRHLDSAEHMRKCAEAWQR